MFLCEQPNEVRAVGAECNEAQRRPLCSLSHQRNLRLLPTKAEQDEDPSRLASPHSSPPEVEGRRSQDFQPTPKEDVFLFQQYDVCYAA